LRRKELFQPEKAVKKQDFFALLFCRFLFLGLGIRQYRTIAVAMKNSHHPAKIPVRSRTGRTASSQNQPKTLCLSVPF
jgi:hypothetical protein